jgi:hypothetical protein
MKNPNSVLANVPQGEFTSRYSDPKSRAASGSLIAFVSGGHLVPNPESRGLVGGILNVAGQAVRGEKQGSGWDRMNAANQYNQAAQAHYHQYQTQQFQADPNQPYPNEQYGYADLPYQNPYSRDYQGKGKAALGRHANAGVPGLGSSGIVGPVGAFKKLLRKVCFLPFSPAGGRGSSARANEYVGCAVPDGCQHAESGGDSRGTTNVWVMQLQFCHSDWQVNGRNAVLVVLS